jgi:hypothetical protein
MSTAWPYSWWNKQHEKTDPPTPKPEPAPKPEPENKEKNPAAVALGRLGGLKGGAESLTAKRRAAIAKKAALARWKTKS